MNCYRLFCILQSVARWDLGVFAGCLSTWCMASLCVSSIFFESLKSEACNWWYLRTYLSPFCSVLRCTKHGWKLDPTTMKYVNPPDSFSQDKLGAAPPSRPYGALGYYQSWPRSIASQRGSNGHRSRLYTLTNFDTILRHRRVCLETTATLHFICTLPSPLR